jgi:NEDD8-activating enzyme E1
LKKPSVRTEAKSLYYQAPRSLEVQTRPNLAKKMVDVVADGEEIAVTDPAFQIDFRFKIVYTE